LCDHDYSKARENKPLKVADQKVLRFRSSQLYAAERDWRTSVAEFFLRVMARHVDQVKTGDAAPSTLLEEGKHTARLIYGLPAIL
jgi:hypothetical protein